MTQNKYDFYEFTVLKKRLQNNSSPRLKVVSDSMYPTIKIGQELEVISRPINELKIFDIIVFWQHQQLNSHFLWHINYDSSLLTRSLKEPGQSDHPIPESHYLGVVMNAKLSGWQKFKILCLNIIKSSS